MKLLIASHAPFAPTDDGRWRAFNRVAEVAEDLAALGWHTTLIGRLREIEDAQHVVAPDVAVLALGRSSGREWLTALRAVATADRVLIFMPSLACALLALIVRRKGVMYVGGAWGLRDDFPGWRGPLERLAARQVASVVASGHSVAEYFSASTDSVELTVPLVPGAVRDRLRGQPSMPSADEPLRVLFVGALNPKKGVLELLEAIPDVPGVVCRIVGPLHDRGLGERLRREVRDNASLEYAGYVEWPQLADHYCWANVLALPSHSEGFPRVAFEASAYGVALVLTPVGGIPARLRHGRDALLVPVGDPSALRDALTRLADPQLRASLARAAHATLAAAFTESDAATQFDRILRAAGRTTRSSVRSPRR